MHSKRRSGFQNDTRAYGSGRLYRNVPLPYAGVPSNYQARAFYYYFGRYV